MRLRVTIHFRSGRKHVLWASSITTRKVGSLLAEVSGKHTINWPHYMDIEQIERITSTPGSLTGWLLNVFPRK